MSNPPDIVTGELEATSVEQRPAESTETRELWASGTEVPSDRGRWTDEGPQEMREGDSGDALAGQMGALVDDDYVEELERRQEERERRRREGRSADASAADGRADSGSAGGAVSSADD